MCLIRKFLLITILPLMMFTPLIYAVENAVVLPVPNSAEQISVGANAATQTLLQQNKKTTDRFQARIAVVDVESILENSYAIAHIKKSIANISKQIQKEFSEKELSLKSIETDLIQQRGVLSKEQFDVKVTEFNKQVSVAQQEMQKKKNALEQAHTKAISEVHNNTLAVISVLSKKRGFNVVLPSAQVFFVENDLNITLEVITCLNERLKTVEIKYNLSPEK